MKKSLFKLMEINQKKHWWYISRRKIFFYLLRNLKQKKMKILDYGCGVGSNISVLKMISKNIEVYDYNKNILKQVIKINKIKAYKKNNKYDLILLTDVLEHVKKDKNLFDKLSRQLNKNGHMFLTVPAFQFLYSNKDVLAGHFRRYNKTQLVKT